ncbi:MAG: YabP/YqfC family sporulation protein [Clostridiales bacterium]
MVKNKLAAAMANALELPEEVALSLPRLTLIGDGRLLAENHQGVIVYASNRIVFATVMGEVEIAGANLSLGRLSPGELTITGEIAGVTYLNKEQAHE